MIDGRPKRQLVTHDMISSRCGPSVGHETFAFKADVLVDPHSLMNKELVASIISINIFPFCTLQHHRV